MRIIIVGAGKTAEVLVRHLEKTSHDVIVVDKSRDRIEEITNEYSVNGVYGSGATREVLLSAGADTADVIISLTQTDEINLLVCSMAKSLGTRFAAAQLERDELIADENYIKEKFGIDYVLTPNLLVCETIMDQVCFNSANRVESFFDSDVLLAEITIDKDSILADSELKSLKPMLGSDFLIFGVLRNDKLMVPRGDFVLKDGDSIGIIADKDEMLRLFEKVRLTRKPERSVMIIGGAELGESVAARLIKKHITVRLVESNADRCSKLAEKLPKAKIIFGNETDVDLLESEDIEKCDACICVTDSDETNLLSSLIAWTNGIDNIITRINSDSYDRALKKVTINITLSPERCITQTLLGYIQSIGNGGKKNGASKYFSLGPAILKIDAFNIPVGFTKADIPLMSDGIHLKKGAIIGAVERGNRMFIPKGSDELRSGDRIYVISENHIGINALMDLFE